MWWQCYVSQICTTPICLGWRWSITDVREGQQGEINVTKVGDESLGAGFSCVGSPNLKLVQDLLGVTEAVVTFTEYSLGLLWEEEVERFGFHIFLLLSRASDALQIQRSHPGL